MPFIYASVQYHHDDSRTVERRRVGTDRPYAPRDTIHCQATPELQGYGRDELHGHRWRSRLKVRVSSGSCRYGLVNDVDGE